MVHRIEIGFREGVRDSRGESVAERARGFLGLPAKSVRVCTVYKVDSGGEALSREEIETIRQEFADPVIQVSAIGRLEQAGFHWLVTVGFRPGVTDNVGASAREAVEDIIERKLPSDAAVYTETQYFVTGGKLTREDAHRLAVELLANELIERVSVESAKEWRGHEPDVQVPAVRGGEVPEVRTVVLDVSDEELMRISHEGILSLSLDEMRTIRDYFASDEMAEERKKLELDRSPTDVELEMLAQTWSEHCKHKIFNARIRYVEAGRKEVIDSIFKTYVQGATEKIRGKRPWLVSVFHDNAGVVRFDEQTNLAFKIETHNSPSALDPYGGAMTGIVGVNRDPFGTGMGAELLINVWGYCLGSPFYSGELPKGLLHPRRIRDGVHQGVIDGGNQSGIPYARGWEIFDARYIGKPLVYCGTVGIMPNELLGKPSHEKSARPGDLIVMCGGRIGKDGIHGATFSSEELHEDSPSQAVQIGDPITQKRMTGFLLEARDRGLYACITDNGAGGLSSSVGETAIGSNGCELDLSLAPLKYTGLAPWEILLSEAQERMTLAVPPEKIDEFLDLSRRRDVESTVLGRYTDSGKMIVKFGDKVVGCVGLDFLHNGLPVMELDAVWEPPSPPEPLVPDSPDIPASLRSLLADLNICSNEKKCRQYDHEVKGLSVVKPFTGVSCDVPSDASVFLVRLGSRSGIVLADGILPHYSDVDAYCMAAACVDLAVRRAVASGCDIEYMAGLDNFCWPDPVQSAKTPDGKYKLAQLVRTCRALHETTVGYGVPLISGKDSMKNDSTRGGIKISIPPTLLFSLIGKIGDVSRVVTLDAKNPGDVVYVVGMTRRELGAGDYFRLLANEQGEPGHVGSRMPEVDAERFLPIYEKLCEAIAGEMVASAHAVGRGGLGVALCKVAFGGELGLDIDLRKLSQDGCSRDDELLFSESCGRFLVTVPEGRAGEFERVMAGAAMGSVGRVTESKRLAVTGLSGNVVADEDVMELKLTWKETLDAV